MLPTLSTRYRTLVGGRYAPGNPFGLGVGIGGLVLGWIVASVAVNVWPHGSQGHPLGHFTENLLNLSGLWVGLLAAVLCARFLARGFTSADSGGEGASGVPGSNRTRYFQQLRSDYGVFLRPVDIPLGIVAGLIGQYVLTPLLELPLVPFVHDLSSRLSEPANSLTRGITGTQFAILGVFVCLGSPIVEELYFRGLILRALFGRWTRPDAREEYRGVQPGLPALIPILICGVFFGLVHFEPLQFLALAGFGVLLSALAWSTGRLGPGFIAHVTFNTATFIALSRTH